MSKELSANTNLSHYRIVSKIGAGGMGEVYLAEDTRLGRKVAIKFLSIESRVDEQARKRLIREAQAAARLDHPNICAIHEVGEEDDQSFIVMQYVDGETLAKLVQRKALELREALDIAVQVADALAEAHSRGIIHRDIKPANIMITPRGQAKVMDFGLAKVIQQKSLIESEAETEELLTRPDVIVGTVPYMSPEQARGETLDLGTDIFSFGAVLYEIISGRQPFLAESAAGTISAIMTHQPPPLARYSREAPAELERIVAKALAKDREDRYQSAKDLLIDLRQLKKRIEVEAEIERTRSAERDPEASAKTLKPETKTSIAVLPFVNISNDPDNEYFCDGLAEELLNALSKIGALRVAARTSAFSLKGKETDIREIGQKLNVGAVLEGSVRKSGNRLRITAQLINIADGYHLWSERYDREMKDIFDIQDEISSAIVDALKVKLLGAEKTTVLKRYTDNTDVYQLYLKGRFHFGKWTEQGFKQAVDYYEQAIAIEPGYAPAFAALAETYLSLWYFGHLSPTESEPRWKEAITRALDIDSDLAEGHFALAESKSYHDWDWLVAEREFKLCLELNPNYARAHEQYAILLSLMGRHEEAFASVIRAVELDPLSFIVNLNAGWVFWVAGRCDRMRDQAQRLIDLDPNFNGGYWIRGTESWVRGKFRDAIRDLEKARDLGGGPVVLSLLGCVYGLSDERMKAEQLLEQLREMSTRRYVGWFQIGLVYAGMGDNDRAFEWLERAYKEREGVLIFARQFAKLVPSLSTDPRLMDLIRRIGLPE